MSYESVKAFFEAKGIPNEIILLEEVFPAGGTANSAVKFTIEELEKVTNGKWVDVTK